jgi:hypothetical protein
MATRRIALVLSLALSASTFMAAEATAACALGPSRIALGEFPPEAHSRAFYPVLEPASDQSAAGTIVFFGGCGTTMQVGYSTTGGSADSNDYVPTSTTAGPVFVDPDGTVTRPLSVTIKADSLVEPVVESVDVALSNPSGSPETPGLSTPSSASFLIIDTDDATRVGFEGAPLSVSESFPTVRVPVFSAGSTGDASVGFTVSPSGANPATAGADYSVTSSGTLSFTSSQRVRTIDLSIVNDEVGEAPEEVTITLTGSPLGSTSTTKVTILDNEESDPPTSRLHHPRHKWRYKKSDYRIREVHVFTSDNPGGAGVTAAQFALRRNMKNGQCQWLAQKGWKQGDCQNREWLPTTYDSVGELWRYRPKQLKSSVGTKIKDYTAFSRAIDGAGNVERDFNEKRNANTFEVKRSKKGRR